MLSQPCYDLFDGYVLTKWIHKYRKRWQIIDVNLYLCYQLRPCLWLISCCSGEHQTVYRYQRNQAESCEGYSAVEIRAASTSAKFRQSNRTDKWIELTMQLFHSCLTTRVGTWSIIRFVTQYMKKDILYVRAIHASPKPNFIIIHNVCTWNASCSLWIRNVMCKDFATTVRRHRYTNTYQTQYIMRMLHWWIKAYCPVIYWQTETSVLDNIHNFCLA